MTTRCGDGLQAGRAGRPRAREAEAGHGDLRPDRQGGATLSPRGSKRPMATGGRNDRKIWVMQREPVGTCGPEAGMS
ncbi:MAG: hypothetical protein LBT40_10950 [Deltaproteobacteria bacterium]|nr:hypothetical protein [Deltaproteobacteria bacterium]